MARRSGSDRPLLLLDVDGVLNVLGPGPGCRMRDVVAGGSVVRFRADLPDVLARLGKRFELVWATTWESAANDCLAEPFGLPALPQVSFSAHPETDWVGPDETWKLPAVREAVGDRPCAFLDDDLGQDAHAWARYRAASVPTLVLDVDPSTGLTDADVERLLKFAASLGIDRAA